MKNRPAETAGVAGAIGVVVAHLLGVTDAATITALGVIIGCIPAVVTAVVHRLRQRKRRTE